MKISSSQFHQELITNVSVDCGVLPCKEFYEQVMNYVFYSEFRMTMSCFTEWTQEIVIPHTTYQIPHTTYHILHTTYYILHTTYTQSRDKCCACYIYGVVVLIGANILNIYSVKLNHRLCHLYKEILLYSHKSVSKFMI